MTRNTRLAIGVMTTLLLAPLMLVFFTPGAGAEQGADHMSPLGGMNLTTDFTGYFAMGAVGLVGLGFIASSFFGRDRETIEE